MGLSVNVGDEISLRERLGIRLIRRDQTGPRRRAAVDIVARDDHYRAVGRATWLEHVWDRERDAHIETALDKETGDLLFRKVERISARREREKRPEQRR
jgi:hypothetical protein